MVLIGFVKYKLHFLVYKLIIYGFMWFVKHLFQKIRHNPTFSSEIFFMHNAQLYSLYIMHYIHIFLSVIIMAILEYMPGPRPMLIAFHNLRRELSLFGQRIATVSNILKTK